MVKPGDTASDCPRCGASRVLIGYENSVFAAHCENCSLTVALEPPAMTMREVRDAEEDWNADEWEPAGTSHGPDPWGD